MQIQIALTWTLYCGQGGQISLDSWGNLGGNNNLGFYWWVILPAFSNIFSKQLLFIKSKIITFWMQIPYHLLRSKLSWTQLNISQEKWIGLCYQKIRKCIMVWKKRAPPIKITIAVFVSQLDLSCIDKVLWVNHGF